LSAHAQPSGPSLIDRRLPPVTEIGAASMIAIAGGVIYLAAYLPKHAPLVWALVLLALAAALQVTNIVLLSRLRDFAWDRFFQVGKWALLAYAVIAGMIEFAFVFDHTRGAQLAVMTAMLALFMLNVPVLIAFTVARYQSV
jgi:1,4-dihydroxy-2-naphthoate octaprenyltransferase